MACNRLRLDLPGHLWEKVIWFHSGMTMEFRVDAMEKLKKGELWGICCTDAAGMVSGNCISITLVNLAIIQGSRSS